ncbi:MAG: tetratricopeptide repeat protein [Acidobacteriaceae bacterium]|nr:tetratricopeptide repeat protein [Acidobacteriaceae bacterium]
MRFAVLLLACCSLQAATQLDQCRALQRHGKIQEAKSCFAGLLRSSDPFLQAEGLWAADRYSEANERFRQAVKLQPKSALVRGEWGFLFFDHHQPDEAVKLFTEAIEIDPNYVPAYLGLAQAAAEGYSKQAVEFAQKALEHNPKSAEAHELLAYLALEDSNPKLATEEAQKALALSDEALDGMAVLASIDWLNGKTQSPWTDRIFKINPVYGAAYARGAHFLEINRRYQEAITYGRKALELDPNLWDARTDLGINLMRLGDNAGARQELKRCYDAHHSSAQTRNALKFLDTLSDYQTFKSNNVELVLNKKEAALLRPYIEPELQKAVATYGRKYKMQLPGPLRLEIYPNHEDFIVRVLGLPGQGGLLGVTFGLVVAMDSPSARPPGSFNWASTMWHELSHAYVVTATRSLVPRWFTEGVSVHEETEASPDWGDRMTPDIVSALREKKLLPVLDLDRGFIRPEYPGQVIVSYFEAGRICDFIAKKWGDDAILGMIHSYAARKTTAEAIQENLHESPAAFDKEFSAWLDGQTSRTVQHFDQWKNGMKDVYAAVEAGKKGEAASKASALRDLYPDYVGSHSPYEVLAADYLAHNNRSAAEQQLERYRDIGGNSIEVLKTLANLEAESGKSDQARATLQKLIYVYPEDEETHRRLGGILLENNDANGAIREYQAVLNLKTADSAEAHYDLAKALRAAKRNSEAKDQVLLALESAPSFKPAQQLLLQLNQE